jgi:crotonobetainyl-CoA:carnitine CoA-transferase CaiB-like acyl-CoA transferase
MLEGFRVLDCSGEPGFLAGKILGDMGADVVKLEAPGGDEARRGPYLGDIEDPERSLVWLSLNTSKRGITLDLDSERGGELFRRLVPRFDVVLETDLPGSFDRRGIGFESLRRSHPGLVWCALTAFGQTGPYAEYRASDLSVVAMGGNAHATGWIDRAQIRCTMPTSHYHAAPEAALGIALALYGREESGRGQLVDVSMQETQLQTLLSLPAQVDADPARFADRQRPGDRQGRSREIWRVKDGYVSYGLRGGPSRIPNLKATVLWMEECGMAPRWLIDHDWAHYNHNTMSVEDFAPFEEAFGAFFASKTMRELFEGAVARRILLAPCNDAREISENEQLRSRDLFVTLDYPELGASIEHPGFFAKTSRNGVRLRRRAPRIGEHNVEIYSEIGLDVEQIGELAVEGVL